MKTMFKHLLIFLIIISASGIINPDSYASQENLHLYLYSYNTYKESWQIIWQEIIEPETYSTEGLSNIRIPEMNINDIFIAIQGQGVYYKNIKSPGDKIDITFSDRSIEFFALDWISTPIPGIHIELFCYIPGMEEYIEICQITHNYSAVVTLNHINPEYRYKINISGPDIYEKEMIFSSEHDFETISPQNRLAEYLFSDFKSVYLVKKNSIYGSILFEKSSHQPTAGHVKLCLYQDTGDLKDMQIKSFYGNRFLFSVPEELNSEEFCILVRDPFSRRTLTYDLFVSEEAHDIYIEEQFGIHGRVSNRDIRFPALIKAEIYYYYEYTALDSAYNEFNNYIFSDKWYETDYNGYFIIPGPNPTENIGIMDHNLRNDRLYADLILKEPGSESALSYRYYFDDKIIRKIKTEDQFLYVGDIYFQQGIEAQGYIVDTNNKPVPDTRVIFGYAGSYRDFRVLIGLQAKGDLRFVKDYLDFGKMFASLIRVTTDEKGEFYINKDQGLIPDEYEIYLYHDSYVLTRYPGIDLRSSGDLGRLIIADGNELTVNVFTDSDKSDIEVMLDVPGNILKLELYSYEDGLLKYYINKLSPWDGMEVMLYKSSVLLDKKRLDFNYDERNISKTINFYIN